VTREWDARTYDLIADPMTRWGAAVLGRLPLDGTERVLDAGCGSGRVTELLAERLPGGRVVALDASSAMIEAARERLARFGERVDYVVADLGRPLPLDPVDAVLSTATFHWVPDHDALFRNLAAVIRPGGRLVAQCGGHGNVAEVKQAGIALAREAPYAEHFGDWGTDWIFATPEEMESRLLAAGFGDVWCWLSHVEVDPGDPAGYLRAICLGSFVARLPEELRDRFVADALERLPDPLRIHYVRLNILARRPD
jgi:trans-aconitate 2-methyltransferase